MIHSEINLKTHAQKRKDKIQLDPIPFVCFRSFPAVGVIDWSNLCI